MKPTEKQALGSQEKAVLESWKGKWEEESIALIRFITILNVRIRLKKYLFMISDMTPFEVQLSL